MAKQTRTTADVIADLPSYDQRIIREHLIELDRLRARVAESIALLEKQATVVDSGKVQALVMLRAAVSAGGE